MRVNDLTVIAARILCQLALNEQDFLSLPVPEQMEHVGCHRFQTFWLARRELESKGYVEIDRGSKEYKMSMLSKKSINNNNNILILDGVGNGSSGGEGSEQVTENVLQKVLPITESVLHKVLPNEKCYVTESVIGNEKCDTESVTYHLTRCEEVDALDSSGDLVTKNSPAATRRLAQIPVIQGLYAYLYPEDTPLTSDMAKKWLSMCENSACAVFDFLIENKKMRSDVNSRKTFVTNALRKIKRRAEQPFTDPQPPSKPQPIIEQLEEPSAEWLERQRKAKEKYAHLLVG